MHGEAIGRVAYRKPVLLLLTLRNHVVGAAPFDRGDARVRPTLGIPAIRPRPTSSARSRTSAGWTRLFCGPSGTHELLDLGIERGG
jgi:hypothetical protein